MTDRKIIPTSSLIFFGSLLVLIFALSSTAWADLEPDLANLQRVRVLKNKDLLPNLDAVPSSDEGVAFPPGANIVVKIDTGPGAESADFGLLSATGIYKTIKIADPINTAFDAGYTFVYDSSTQEMIAIGSGDYRRFDATEMGVQNPQGMTINGKRNKLYILDVRKEGPDLVTIKDYGSAPTPAKRRDLSNIVGQHGRPRCIAFNPSHQSADSHPGDDCNWLG